MLLGLCVGKRVLVYFSNKTNFIDKKLVDDEL